MRSELHDKLDIPAGMKARLEAYKRSVRRVKLAEGLLAAAFGLLVSYICVFGLDRVMNTPAWLRGGILVSGALGLGLFFPLKCHRWIWGTRRMEQVARLLKHKFPRTSDQLLGIVELARSESEQQRSQTLVRAAMQQVDASIRDRDFTDAVPRPRHRQWAWATVVPAILVIVAVVAVPSAGANTFLRWIMPWKNTERYTFARLEPLPEKVVVPYAESFDIDAVLQENTEWSPASGQVRYGKQPPVRATLSGRRYHFELPPQKEAARLALSIGDVRESIVVEPMARPELKQLRAHIRLPDYLQYSTELVADVRGGVVSLVRGSQPPAHRGSGGRRACAGRRDRIFRLHTGHH